MAELKTRRTEASARAFLDAITDEGRRKDCVEVVRLMQRVTKAEPRMWGPSIVGFGDCKYVYPTGREMDWFLTGFSPRKQALTLYVMPGVSRYDALMKKLGKHTTGKSCLYLKRLDDVDRKVLEALIRESVAYMKAARRTAAAGPAGKGAPRKSGRKVAPKRAAKAK